LSAACAVTRPSASMAQSIAARTKPVMMEPPERTNAAGRTEMREKVTVSWPLKGVADKSHATFVEQSLPCRQPTMAQRGVAGRPKPTTHRTSFVAPHRKRFGGGLAGKRIFHIGNAMKAKSPDRVSWPSVLKLRSHSSTG
jgi:hypothetical protein